MPGAPSARDARAAERALDDALYYLRQGCGPCADRHFQRARRHGASAGQVAAVRALAARG